MTQPKSKNESTANEQATESASHPSQVKSFLWFLPTFHGDIRLESKGKRLTSLHAFELTPTEKEAMKALRTRALKEPSLLSRSKTPWATEKDFPSLTSGAYPSYRTKEGVTIELKAPIEEVQAVLAKGLKPNRKLLSAVMFANGKMAEIRMIKGEDGEPVPETLAKHDEEKAPESPPYRKSDKPEEKPEPKAAATVATPQIGCPSPMFEEAEIRATRVLEVFLSPTQLDDYRKYGAFLAVGHDTGHRYKITNRERPNMMRHSASRSLFDLDEGRALCVHDWAVPAPEEMLALFMCVSLPGNESAIRALPPVWGH